MHSVGLPLTVVLFCVASVFWTNCDAATSKEGTTSSSTQTDPPASSMSILEFIAAMPVTAQLRTGAVLVAFLAILFWDRRADTWIKSLLAMGTLGGLAYFFNPAHAGHVVGSSGPLHEYMVQVLGAFMLSEMYMVYSLSADNGTRLLLFLAQAVSGVMVMMIRTYGHFKYQNEDVHFDNEHLTLGLPIAACYTLGGCIFLYRHRDGGHSEVISTYGLNGHLLVDGFIMCSLGLMDLAFPDLGLSMLEGVKADGVLATLQRHIGAIVMIEGIMSLLFATLSNDNDKRAKLRSNLVVSALILPVAVLYQIKYQWMDRVTFVVGLLMMVPQCYNAAYALYIRDARKKRV